MADARLVRCILNYGTFPTNRACFRTAEPLSAEGDVSRLAYLPHLHITQALGFARSSLIPRSHLH
jgi:hypothetical protein